MIIHSLFRIVALLSDLQAGDIITILNADDKEWWQGELEGNIGYFPSSYVRLRED